jgi:hypothetical protein
MFGFARQRKLNSEQLRNLRCSVSITGVITSEEGGVGGMCSMNARNEKYILVKLKRGCTTLKL